mgnify:CR=1 FL=1|tara:strand:- start:1786 stop:2997 length:1212 start_codon:yes stop_codon:yes gene_type:complete
MQNFIFRVDSSRQIGTGHVFRSLNLAEMLKKLCLNIQIIWISKLHDGNLTNLVKSRHPEFTYIDLDIDSNHNINSDTSTWLGGSVESEVDIIVFNLIKLKIQRISAIIIDHYAIDKKWEISLRKSLDRSRIIISKMVVIDDLVDRVHSCEILTDQTYRSKNEKDIYHKKQVVQDSTKCLIGCEYVLLNSKFYETRNKKIKIQNECNKSKLKVNYKNKVNKVNKNKKINVNISFGGSDIYNLTKNVVSTLLPIFKNSEQFRFSILLGGLYKITDKMELQEILSDVYNFRIMQNLNFDEICDLLLDTDVCIGAGGVSLYERCCLGIPSIIINLADNQLYNAINLNKVGAIMYIGNFTNWDKLKLIDLLNEFGKDSKSLQKMSDICLKLVDGKGCERVAKEILFND